MSNTAYHREQIEEQAADWFALISLGDATAQEKEEFNNWLQTSPMHTQVYEEFVALWQDMEPLPEEAYSAPESNQQEEKSKASPVKKAKPDNVIPFTRWPQKITKRHYSFAATLLVACCALVFSILEPKQQAQIYATGLAEVQDITLQDNTKITLDAKTHLEVSFNKDKRLISMKQGRAFFRVASQLRKDGSKHPFVIQSGKMQITVVGTEFDVHIKNKEASVAVAEGKVEVETQSSKEKLGLTMGQKVIVVGSQLDTLGAPESITSNAIGQWRSGHLSYANATLKEVLDDARRYHDGSIVLGDEALGDLRLTTAFDVNQIPQMAQTLEAILPVRVYFKPDNLILILPKH